MTAIGPVERQAAERVVCVRAVARASAGVAGALALLTLFAWASDTGWPVDVRRASAALKPQTCIAVLLLAAACIAAARRAGGSGRMRGILALAGGTLPVLALTQYATGFDLGIDLALFRENLLASGTTPPGRMSVLTALFLTIVATSLALPEPRTRAAERVRQTLAAMMVVACFLILGFQLHGSSAEGVRVTLMPVSVTAAVALFEIGLAALLARPEGGWLEPVLREDAGGHLLRRMLPAAGLLPFVLGFAVVVGATHDVFGVRTAIGLLVGAVALPLAVLVVWSARSINRLAGERARSEVRLRRLVDASPIGIAFGHLDGRLEDANDAFLRIAGRSLQELVAGRLNWRRLTSPEHVARDEAALAELERSGSTRPYEKEIDLPDGSRRPVLGHAVKLSDADDVAAVLVDVTRQRSAQVRLRQSEARYRRIVETAQEGIFILDAAGRMRFANASLARMLGCRIEDLVERPFLSLVYDEDRSGWTPLLRADAPAVQPTGDLRLRCPDGDELWAVVSVSPIEAGLGLPEGRLVMLTDVTARRRSELALQQAARVEATSTLAAGVAHDVNNLMAAVLGNADLLRDDLPRAGEAAEMLESIREAASRAAELAQQLLAYARGGRYWSRPVDLNQVAQRTLEIQRRTWPRGIDVKLDFEATLPSVIADASQMSQVVMNLCANGVEAMDGRGRLTLATRTEMVGEGHVVRGAGGGVTLAPGCWIRLSVEDQGCGMDALTAARVFEPFFSTKFPGRGLGLAAVYGIVQNHGGEITLDTLPGRGTRVDVWLPAAREAIAEEAPRAENDVPQGAETVLVVDDDETVLTVTARLLERLGYHVVRARNGREAVTYARTAGVALDAVILDLDMPVMDGASAFPLLRAARPGLPIVVCSGYELDPGSPRLRGIVPDAYLAKPFRRDALARVLRETLDRAAARA